MSLEPTTKYRAACGCGWVGPTYEIDYEAYDAAYDHIWVLMPENGGRHDGRRHSIRVEVVR